mgnify:FL=1
MSKERKIGSLWEKESAKGTRFLSGELLINGKKVPIIVFQTSEEWRNEGNRRPDWEILKQEENNQGLVI